MNIRHLLTLATLTVATSVLNAVDEDILLRGILNLGNRQAFSISNAAGTESAWLKLGQSFKGYELKSYDAESETLLIVFDGRELELSMEAVVDADANASAEDRLAEATRMMELMNFEKMMDDALAGQMKAMSQMMRKQMGSSASEEDLAFREKAMREMFSEIDWKPIKEGMIEVYAEVYSQAELKGMSDFYTSPVGQATLEKMPEVQQKTMEVMMPALMQATQNMQQKLVQYQREKQAKEATAE
ncbi:DUF2059 domain-containing protein [Coraliomargarita akajimensis]|uniref:DUF2059 domain-containing protein n=1 Tax=Coraliomargarita akajimensis (strain DSM 45221 / IAM 15411 / JCM 23193 / KCTC 12865 / 04OKA010-24) TaxID=583355 RepID=D5ELC2_CORAD|nr:DUF2059 domain-containing protein [Coraliomargarita akajimensis]ADE55058.1 Protein of unknown function DUF2059 [Coraliomargarita akajimensis DSM 45221]